MLQAQLLQLKGSRRALRDQKIVKHSPKVDKIYLMWTHDNLLFVFLIFFFHSLFASLVATYSHILCKLVWLYLIIYIVQYTKHNFFQILCYQSTFILISTCIDCSLSIYVCSDYQPTSLLTNNFIDLHIFMTISLCIHTDKLQ